MKYRALGKTGAQVSEIGLGCEHLQGKDAGLISDVINAAVDAGVNIMDVFMGEPEVRTNIGKALGARRKQVLLQAHFGAIMENGQYQRTRDLALGKRFFEDFMERFQTDYVDIGMLHFVDDEQDLKTVLEGGIYDYLLSLKEKGVVKYIGMSSHNPLVALKAVPYLDVLMFSVNPAYDLLPEDTVIDNLFQGETYQNQTLLGMNPVRERLYNACAERGVAITVMKALGGSMLLYDKASPFGMAMTPHQAAQYALERPAVASVLLGCQTVEQVLENTREVSPEELDYSAILGASRQYAATGRCMYCNHCLPCPQRIDIAQVNKYYDIAKHAEAVPETVREHYKALESHAGDCIACGACESRCPFKVPVIERMEAAKALFGI